MPTLLIYITGHGFGHARRVYAILREMLVLGPDLQLVLRTSAPAWIFANLPRTRISAFVASASRRGSLDFGVHETDPITIDIPGSIATARDLLANSAAIIAEELALLNTLAPDAVLADIPYLPGHAIAAYRARTGCRLPAVATGNFTWDFMYARMDHPAAAEIAAQMRTGYQHFDLYLRLPFAHDTTAFARIIDLPLVANPPRHTRAQTLATLSLNPSPRPRILLGMRGGMADALILAAAQACPEYDFLTRPPLTGDLPKNLHLIHPPATMDFSDLLAACDVCISKLGYGLAADAAVAGCALLWPPRQNFFEDPLFDPLLSQITRHHMIPREDYLAGHWRTHLHTLLAQPTLPRPRTDGAGVAAEMFLQHLKV